MIRAYRACTLADSDSSPLASTRPISSAFVLTAASLIRMPYFLSGSASPTSPERRSSITWAGSTLLNDPRSAAVLIRFSDMTGRSLLATPTPLSRLPIVEAYSSADCRDKPNADADPLDHLRTASALSPKTALVLLIDSLRWEAALIE